MNTKTDVAEHSAATDCYPCPFCGKTATVIPSAIDDSAVECRNRCCHVKPRCAAGSAVEAIERWNQRPRTFVSGRQVMKHFGISDG